MENYRRPDYGRQRTTYITEGNTVRVVHTEIDPFYETGDLRRKTMLREKKRQMREAEQAKINRARSVTTLMTVIIVIAAAASFFFGYQYLKLKNSVDTHLASIRTMESKLESIKTENDALEQSIDTSVDLSYVYNVAVNKLGMVHAGEESIIEFEKTESEYVRQYDSIPEI